MTGLINNDETTADEPTAALLTKPHPSWYAFVAASLIAMAFGVYCFWYQTEHNFISTGLRNIGFGGAPWGLYVAFDVIFVGVSFAGITVAAMARLFEVKELKPITRVAELITIVALIAGGCVIVSDLGRPLRGLLTLPRYARPESPFYGTFTLVVAGYLFSSLVFFFLSARADAARMSREGPRALRWFYGSWASGYRDTTEERQRHRRSSFWLSITILPLLITAHSTLGFIFGLQAGRPGWYSALQAPGFVVLAGVSGTAVVILAALSLRRMFKLHDRMPDSGLNWLGTFMWILMAIYLYFMVVEELTATYAGPGAGRDVAHAVVSGAYAPSFWLTVTCFGLTFGIPFIMFLRRRSSMAWLAVACTAAVIGAVLKRLLIVVPSQTHGALIELQTGVYTPTWVEIGIIVGLTGMIAFVVLVFARFFPIVPGSHRPIAVVAPDKPRPDVLRVAVTGAWAAVSVALIVVGLLDSFRIWSGSELDPRIPYSPVIFAFGVMMLFASAVVYETLPGDPAVEAVHEPRRTGN